MIVFRKKTCVVLVVARLQGVVFDILRRMSLFVGMIERLDPPFYTRTQGIS